MTVAARSATPVRSGRTRASLQQIDVHPVPGGYASDVQSSYYKALGQLGRSRARPQSEEEAGAEHPGGSACWRSLTRACRCALHREGRCRDRGDDARDRSAAPRQVGRRHRTRCVMVRPCLAGFGRLISRRSYCPMCDPRPPRVRAKRGTRWQQQQFRNAVLARAGGRCERCGSTDRVEAHHLIRVANGGQHDPALNGQALCVRCHRAR
jgi:hypothetical protein